MLDESIAEPRKVKAVLVYLTPIMCLVVLGLVLNTTNPIQTGPASILIVFALLYLLIFTLLAVILRTLNGLWHFFKHRSFSLRRGYYLLSVISLCPILLIALNTLGQLTILEIVLILLLISLGCFYVLRRVSK